MSKKLFKLSLVLLVLAVLVSGCTWPNWPWKKSAAPNPKSTSTEPIVTTEETVTTTNTKQLKKFASYDELKSFLEENSSNVNSYTSRSSGRAISSLAGGLDQAVPQVSLARDSAGAESAASSANFVNSATPSVSLDYSSTNNQVAGVDEADIIKTDGNYIYALVRNELHIIKAVPGADAREVSKITFKSRPQDLFISGTSLAVFGADDQIYVQPLYQSFRRQNAYTFFKVFDLTDPASPREVRDLDFEGNYYDARLIGDYVYLLTNSYGNYIEGEQLVSRVLDKGEVLATKCDGAVKCFAPDVYYFDIPYDNYTFTNITAINVKDNGEAVNGQIYLLNAGQNLYVSQNNIYITYTQYLNEADLEQTVKRDLIYPKLTATEQDKITKIDAAPNFILNANEKKYKIVAVIDHYLNSLPEEEQAALQSAIDTGLKQRLSEKVKDMEKTVIHKIAISGNKIEYRGLGEVSGQVLNQFSMDENGNYFRIATTRNQIWSRLTDKPQESYSNVYVLDADLKTVGSLENLATTEKIYAARFMGDRLYLVTFKRTDPLYVINLADPTKPGVLGAIKIPGFSNYLHPADKTGTKLIGLGRDAEEEANGGVKVKGLKLSLFDFTDVNKPKELDSYLVGDENSDSIALSDHKAFLYSETKNLLVIPAVLRDSIGHLSFAGSLVFNLTDNRFNLKGRIDHSEGGHFTQEDRWGGYSYYDNTVKRSLYIGDALYTFSNKFLKINSLSDLSSIKNLVLTVGGDDYIINTPAVNPTPGITGAGATTPSGTSTPPDNTAPTTGTSTNP
ncbi:MAG: beta-propeller domain-containing protein [Patescibacteria group bacterium]